MELINRCIAHDVQQVHPELRFHLQPSSSIGTAGSERCSLYRDECGGTSYRPGDLFSILVSCCSTLSSYQTHCRQDFPDEYRRWDSCDPFNLFEAPITTYIPPNSKSIETNLKAEARMATLLMIWTDCDREGEHIGSEIVAVCRKVNPRIVVKRARFSAIIAK
jgi:hypothetical protein